MKYLVLMRHAKSSWKDSSLADHERPLNKRGKRDAPRMGNHLQAQGIQLDAILCSTALRARQTVEGFLQEYTFEGDVAYTDDLYPGDPETITSILARLPRQIDTVMVIGHNPGFDFFLEQVCGESEHMPTASIAYIRFPIERWSKLLPSGEGELIQFWKPREL